MTNIKILEASNPYGLADMHDVIEPGGKSRMFQRSCTSEIETTIHVNRQRCFKANEV